MGLKSTPLRLGSYDLVRPLASGGMAELYLARDAENRHAAIKVLVGPQAQDADACAMFLHEGRLVMQLTHPNIAAVYACGVEGETHYLAMEYIHGADLREVVNTALSLGVTIEHATAAAIVRAAALGLDHAHRATDREGAPLGVVHRDVSLSNIMLQHAGGVKVVDFGIAAAASSPVRTAPGVVRGKASYMSPEQATGELVDRRTDVFALGIVLYELTTGYRCFTGDSDFDRMLAIVKGQVIRPHELVPGYPVELEAIVMRALATDRTKRFQTAAHLGTALDRVGAMLGWGRIAEVAPYVTGLMRASYGEVEAPFPADDTLLMSAEIEMDSASSLDFVLTVVDDPRDWKDDAPEGPAARRARTVV